MTTSGAEPITPVNSYDSFTSTVGFQLLQRRGRLVLALALLGATNGLLLARLTPRQYASTAIFIPQSQEGGTSGAELAASQFGLRLPTASAGWGTALYVEVLNSRTLLEPIIRDTLTVTELNGSRRAVLDLLRAPSIPRPEREDAAVRLLRAQLRAVEDKKLNAVRLTVTTRWPSVSYAIAERLVNEVNRFNLQTRKSQAAEERKFIDVQVVNAEHSLREAESQLERFLAGNRSVTSSPQLRFAQDRLERNVALRQTLLTSLLQRREEARSREVRDVPVLTLIERPQLPVVGLGRRTAMRMVLGTFAGIGLGVLLAYALEGIHATRGGNEREVPQMYRIFQWLRALRSRAKGEGA